MAKDFKKPQVKHKHSKKTKTKKSHFWTLKFNAINS